MDNKFVIEDKKSLKGHYKSLGLTDSDMIYVEKLSLLKIYNGQKNGYRFMFWLALLVALFIASLWQNIVGIIIGVAVVLPFHFLVGKYKNRVVMINEATDEYCKEIGVEPV